MKIIGDGASTWVGGCYKFDDSSDAWYTRLRKVSVPVCHFLESGASTGYKWLEIVSVPVFFPVKKKDTWKKNKNKSDR